MTTWEFPCPDPASISIGSWASGSVALAGEETDTIYVAVVPSRPGPHADELLAEVQVSFTGGKLVITGPRFTGFRRMKGLDLTVRAPAGSVCDARTASADVNCVGRLGDLSVQTASGDVTVVSAGGRVAVQTASGDIFADQVDGDVQIKSASGDVQVSSARGEVRIDAVSGDVAIGSARGLVVAHTTSGDIGVRQLSSGRAELTALSGDVHVSVTPGVGVYLDLASTSGHVRSDLDEDASAAPAATLEIRCRTISGDIQISKAPAHQSAPA